MGGRGETRGAYEGLVRKPVGKRLLDRSRRKWEDNVKIYRLETG